MPRLHDRIPKYRLHRRSGQAIVTLDGRDHYLGPHRSETSIAAYDRLVAEWLAAGRRPRIAEATAPAPSLGAVMLRFWEHAQRYYRHADGTPTSEVDTYRQVLRHLRRLYSATPATDFGPLALRALREHLIGLGWSRKYINAQIHRVCSMFKWAAGQEMLPVALYQQLKTVEPLRRGRTTAREGTRRGPVPPEAIAAVRPFVSRQVWAMITLQQLTGARPGEIVKLKGATLDRSAEVWRSEPEDHKTAHHGHDRRILFGPRAQRVLRPFLDDRDPNIHLFSPAEAERERRARLTTARRTPLSCGNTPGSNRKASPERSPHDRYDVETYRRAIHRACDLAFPPPPELARLKVPATKGGTRWETEPEWEARLGPDAWKRLADWLRSHRWSPHRLRKNAGTEIRRQFGVEMSTTILGHHSIAMNELYAERNDKEAASIIRKIG